MMNFWTPMFESWAQGFNPSDMPWQLEFDYVETFTYDSKTKSFERHWRDDFNSLDLNRWILSDNKTFAGNSTVFRASQVFTKDGSLILQMEPDKGFANERDVLLHHGLYHPHGFDFEGHYDIDGHDYHVEMQAT